MQDESFKLSKERRPFAVILTYPSDGAVNVAPCAIAYEGSFDTPRAEVQLLYCEIRQLSKISIYEVKNLIRDLKLRNKKGG